MIFGDTLDLGQIYCIERRALVGARHYDLVTPLRVRRIHRTAARSFDSSEEFMGKFRLR